MRKKTGSGRVKRKNRKANGAEVKWVWQGKGDKSRRGQNQGEFGEQVNIVNKELLSQWSENGMCSFLHKHKVAKILGPVSYSSCALLFWKLCWYDSISLWTYVNIWYYLNSNSVWFHIFKNPGYLDQGLMHFKSMHSTGLNKKRGGEGNPPPY